MTKWETQTGVKVKAIITDNATELNGIGRVCRANGATHQRTDPEHKDPYAYQQNGRVERLNRTMQERARAILAKISLPEEYWNEALLTSNYLGKKSVVSNLMCTPFQSSCGNIHFNVLDVSQVFLAQKALSCPPKVKEMANLPLPM